MNPFEQLPEELIAYIFDHVQAAHALSTAMIVNQQWYMHGARNMHHRLVFNLPLNATIDSPDAIMSLMKRLVSPTLSTAHLVHHLTVTGPARADVQNLILDILWQATALRSLDVHGIRFMQGETLLPPGGFTSHDFLPNVVALNVTSSSFLATFPPTRKLHALRIHNPLEAPLLTSVTDPNGQFVKGIQCLELAISVDSPADAVRVMAHLASALARSPLGALALQFVLPRAGLMSWSDFEDTVHQMGPSLQTLPNLSILSLVFRPDPIMPASLSAEPGAGDQQRETIGRGLAERLISENGLSRLTRIELRWHGWSIEEGVLTALPQTELLRPPHRWMYRQLDETFPWNRRPR
ncbi:hypothetical protein C8Q79DRAFT_703727 [Trametes meyenii]|nr:hypothetical protein C8Q79DRAFT_703727 [Trametes meyenii]